MKSRPWLAVVPWALTLGGAATVEAQYQITSADGKSAIKFGILGQVQYEAIDNTGSADNTQQNLFVRRLRLLTGGKLGDNVSFFVETDSPNLGKAAANGTKNDAQVFLQDVILTYTFSQAFQIDGGLLLTPNSHNSEQGATTLLPVDYSPTSFLYSGPTGSRVGRDYGAQARGYLADNHFEYRLGIFQGVRGENSVNPFRTVARVVWYPFDAETGFFYSGTYFGKKRILALGASYDHQMDYKSHDFDVFFDWPVNHGDAVTLQGDFQHLDGGTTLASLPKQDAWFFEGSYYFDAVKVGPFVQISRVDYKEGSSSDQRNYEGGLAYWAKGHNFNVKLGYTRLEKEGAPNRNQVVVQMQVFTF